MGAPREPAPALLVIGALYGEAAVLAEAVEALTASIGPIRRVGPVFDFHFTDYYQREMGADLKRCFLAADQLVPREALAELKLWTQRIEQAHRRPDDSRRINLDPGLVTLENFVLASTKIQPQRVYLRAGIFAEVTLVFVNGRFAPLERTYPDYRSDEVRALLAGLRMDYKRTLRDGSRALAAPALVRAIQEDRC